MDVRYEGVSIELAYVLRDERGNETAVRVPFESEKLARRHSNVITALLNDRELFCDLAARHLDRRVESKEPDHAAIVRDAAAIARLAVRAFYHDELPF